MRRLTIALCLHGYFPDQFYGTAVYARQLAGALQQIGHRVVIVVPRFDASIASPRPAGPEFVDGIEVRRVLRPRVRGIRDSFDDPRLTEPLRDIFTEIKADVVHLAHFLGLGTALMTAAEHLNLPVFVTLTDFHGFCHRGTLLNSWGNECAGPDRLRTNCLSCGLRDRADEQPQSWTLAYLASWFARPTSAVVLPLLSGLLPRDVADEIEAVRSRPDHLRTSLSRARAAIAPTHFLREAYRQHGYAIPVEVQHFGIDANRAPRGEPQTAPLRIGFIGQIGRHKGCHVLLAAARRLPPGRVALRIWGDLSRNPGYARQLKQAARGLDVTFTGPLALDEMDAALRSIDMLVLPSIWAENAPLTLLQALACHTPCIVSDQPGMTEFVQDGRNGHVFPTEDARALAAILLRLAGDPEQVRRLSRATAYERTSLDMAQSVVDLYDRHAVA